MTTTRLHQFEVGPMQNFIYLIADTRTKQCAVVDPAWNFRIILEEAEKFGYTIRHLLCTHSHFDHVNEVEFLLKHVDAEVHMMEQEVAFSGFKCENLTPRSPGDVLEIGDTKIRMLHTPGHTPGSTCYLVNGCIVTGDTMFVDGCGRCDLVGGDPETMFDTLHKLVTDLPGETIMFPGHNYAEPKQARLADQAKTNQWLQHTTVAKFVHHRMIGRTAGTVLDVPPWPPKCRT